MTVGPGIVRLLLSARNIQTTCGDFLVKIDAENTALAAGGPGGQTKQLAMSYQHTCPRFWNDWISMQLLHLLQF